MAKGIVRLSIQNAANPPNRTESTSRPLVGVVLCGRRLVGNYNDTRLHHAFTTVDMLDLMWWSAQARDTGSYRMGKYGQLAMMMNHSLSFEWAGGL